MNPFRAGSVFVLILLILSQPAFAFDDSKLWSVKVGYTLNRSWLDVFTQDRGTPEGILIEEQHQSPLLSLYSPYYYFSKGSVSDEFYDPRAGVYFEVSYSQFNYRMQDVNGSSKDLGTSASGNYFYLAPVLFYDYGDKDSLQANSIILGTGLGLGYLQGTGDIRFSNSDNSLHKLNLDDLGVTIFFLFEYQKNNWFGRVRAGGPVVAKSIYNYGIWEYSLDAGYIFSF